MAQALDRVGDRWTLLIVRELLAGPARFRDLSDGLPGLATNLLTQRLRDLEEDGLVSQVQLPPPAAINVYQLTPLGRSLEPIAHALSRWGMQFMAALPYRDPPGPRSLIMALRILIPEEASRGLRARLELRPQDDCIGLRIEDGRIETTLGPLSDAQATLQTDYRTSLGLLVGKLELAPAIAAGAVRTSGAVKAIDAFAKLLKRAQVLRRAHEETGAAT